MKAEELIEIIEEECGAHAKVIIDKVCRRVMRIMNKKLDSLISNDYPKKFRFIDFLSCEIQSKTFDELNFQGKLLKDYIDKLIDCEYDKLTNIEKTILSYSDFTPQFGRGYEFCDIRYTILPRIIEMLNDHWSSSKKIQNFENNRTW